MQSQRAAKRRKIGNRPASAMAGIAAAGAPARDFASHKHGRHASKGSGGCEAQCGLLAPLQAQESFRLRREGVGMA